MVEFPVLGRTLDLQVRTPSLVTWLQRQWSFPEHALPPVSYAICLEEVDAPPESMLDGTPVSVPLHRVTLTALTGDDVWWFGDARAGVRLRIGDADSRIAVWGISLDEEFAATIHAALFVSIAESLRASGLLPLHAAVAVSGGGATAFAGPSGVGKSTTLWRLMRAGWSPLAEDFAWLDPATHLVYGWDRGLRLAPSTRERFAPELPAEDSCIDADGKLFLPYERLSHPRVRSARLERLALLERESEGGGGGGGGAPMPLLARHEAVRAWWETVGVPLSPAIRERVATSIAMLVQRVDAVRFPLGAGPLPL